MDQNGLQSATFLSITMDMEDYKSSCSTRFDFLLSHLGPKWKNGFLKAHKISYLKARQSLEFLF